VIQDKAVLAALAALIALLAFFLGAIVHSASYKQGYKDGIRHAGEMSK